MARNLLDNGAFYDDLSDWTTQNATHVDDREHAFLTSGACELDASAADAYIWQLVTVPGSGIRRARLVVRAWSSSVAGLVLRCSGTTVHTQAEHTLDHTDVWCTLVADVTVEGGETCTINISLDHETYEVVVYVDDIQFFMVDARDLSAEGLGLELARRRGDPGFMKHTRQRYYQVLNDAIAAAPKPLWRLNVDSSVSTTVTGDGDPVRRYSLAGVTGLTTADQVRRVWMEGSDDQNYQIGRWEVESDLGVLTLALDDDPPEAGRTVAVEFWTPPAELDTLTFSNSTTLDRSWLLRQAMVFLLMEADREEEPEAEAELMRWDQLRQAREGELLGRRRRPAGKVRSLRWN